MIDWTVTQKQRLKELNASSDIQDAVFSRKKERDGAFREQEKILVKAGKNRLNSLRNNSRRPALCELESELVKVLVDAGFIQVVTPIIISQNSLARMSVTEKSSLYKKVYWVSSNQCLRPMLAPNLYHLLKQLSRLWEKPIRIFEVGPCFRKDSEGSAHIREFTMLNLVELGLPEEKCPERLEELADLVMRTSGIADYSLAHEQCDVYGKTVDIVAGLEVASGVTGPHKLDTRWGIFDPWVGLGFGLERLCQVREGYANISRVGRSLNYLDGVRLNI
ncbi:MAG: pyrrolysine--tRNA(Pyl) ligase large subunit [Spirochaetota bacterium]|nr:MAG: pyrrolysine--tRNA(Pyl) ligase large subunit [Spirochaetota bacterium]